MACYIWNRLLIAFQIEAITSILAGSGVPSLFDVLDVFFNEINFAASVLRLSALERIKFLNLIQGLKRSLNT